MHVPFSGAARRSRVSGSRLVVRTHAADRIARRDTRSRDRDRARRQTLDDACVVGEGPRGSAPDFPTPDPRLLKSRLCVEEAGFELRPNRACAVDAGTDPRFGTRDGRAARYPRRT